MAKKPLKGIKQEVESADILWGEAGVLLTDIPLIIALI